MKIVKMTGEKGSYMGRSVFQNGTFVPSTQAAELLKQFTTPEARKEAGIEINTKRYFRFRIENPDEAKLAGAKAVSAFITKDETGQWLFISSNFVYKRGELLINKDNKYYASCEEAENIETLCRTKGLSLAKELMAVDLM